MPADHRWYFSGKGSGAGMMLSASMGPMGVAIGAAIDAGIAKDIGETGSDVDIAGLVQDAFEAKVTQSPAASVTITRYGFQTAASPAHDDPVVPVLHLSISPVGEASPKVIRIPEDLADNDLCTLTPHELAQVRTSQEIIAGSLRAAAECAADLYESEISAAS